MVSAIFDFLQGVSLMTFVHCILGKALPMRARNTLLKVSIVLL